LGAEAKGTTGYAAVRPKDLLNCEIPLPPLDEQQRIVAQIEEFVVQIEEALALRREAVEEAAVLLSRITATVLDDQPWPRLQLGTLLSENPRNGLGPQPEAADGRVMLRINAVSSAPTRFVDMAAAKKVAVSDDAARPFVIQDNDVFIVRFNGDIHRVAKAAIYKGRNEANAVYPDKLIRLRPDPTKMMPDFLVYALGSQMVRGQIESLGRTTAGNIGVSGSDAKSFVVPVPPLSQQVRIVAELDAAQAEVDKLKRLQAETAAELDALLPSLLDRGFRGEL
jgi:type I restriction enzyme S subunit